jgi:hypothetical protein
MISECYTALRLYTLSCRWHVVVVVGSPTICQRAVVVHWLLLLLQSCKQQLYWHSWSPSELLALGRSELLLLLQVRTQTHLGCCLAAAVAAASAICHLQADRALLKLHIACSYTQTKPLLPNSTPKLWLLRRN